MDNSLFADAQDCLVLTTLGMLQAMRYMRLLRERHGEEVANITRPRSWLAKLLSQGILEMTPPWAVESGSRDPRCDPQVVRGDDGCIPWVGSVLTLEVDDLMFCETEPTTCAGWPFAENAGLKGRCASQLLLV
jgi:hypothetical protein